ncbi:MAG TPA: hypothetical protein VJ992_00315 [Gemmatimonadales bacterium]|nr:hypothetical protein [Gemmatimonadales bacterium]
MKQHLFGFVGLSLAVALAAGCKSNPQDPIQAVPVAIKVTSSYLVLDVGDSVRVDAQVVDAQGTPLTTLPDASSNDPGVVSLSTIDPYPVPETSFWAKAESFGAGSITITSGSLSATINVRTVPHSAKVGGLADTVASGNTLQLYPIGLDVNGDSIAVPPDSFTWSTSDASIVDVDSVGMITTKAPGNAVITVTPPGGKSPGLAPVTVVPGTFAGAFSSASAAFGDTLVITPAAALPFDGDEMVTVDGNNAWILGQSADSIAIVVPNVSAVGAQDVVITRIGPDQVAQKKSLNVTAKYTDNGAGTAPDRTAGPFPMSFYISLGADAGTDDFSKFAPAADLPLTVTAQWQPVGSAVDDVDILWCNADCSAYVGNFDGATSNNPEQSSVTVPAAATWLLFFDAYDLGPTGEVTVRITITSP